MPLVISHAAKRVDPIDNVGLLSMILGHHDFDGHDWAVGDEVAFEDGTVSTIVQTPGAARYAWSKPVHMEPEALTALIFKYLQPGPWDRTQPGDLTALFAAFRKDARPAMDPELKRWLKSVAMAWVSSAVSIFVLATFGHSFDFFMKRFFVLLFISIPVTSLVAVFLYCVVGDSPSAVSASATTASKLRELDCLRDGGLVTPEEYQTQRTRILNAI